MTSFPLFPVVRWPAVVAAVVAGTLMVQPRADDKVLAPIVVKGEGLSPSNETGSATRFDGEQIRAEGGSRIQQLFSRVPGMENRGLQIGGVADSITLRGFANGGHGGDLAASIDGIPLNEPTSHADGYVDFNMVIPLELDGMTVYRGPVSALYGNYARAGTVALTSRKGGNYREVDLALGGHGTVDTQFALGSETDGRRLNLAAQLFRTDGAREHSRWSRATVAGRYAIDLGPDVELALSGRFHRGVWDATGRITAAELADRHRWQRANPQSQNDGGDKSYASLRADLGVRIDERTRWLAFVYGVDQSFLRYASFAPATFPAPADEPWPQRKEDYDRAVVGLGTSLNGTRPVFDATLDWVAGIEYFRDSTDSRYHANLRDRRYTARTFDGMSRITDRRMAFDTTALFAQAEWAWRPWLRPTIGLRHDRFDGDCSARGVEVAAGRCGPMNSYGHTSPKFGIRSSVLPGVELRMSWSEGFQLPDDNAKYVVGGNVRPTVFRQLEIGATLRPMPGWLLDIAAYRIDSNHEIYLADAATATYANLGQTRRDGIELDLRYAPAGNWEAFFVGSWFDGEVRSSTIAAAIGKQVPNVPRQLLTAGATWRPIERWSTTASVRKAGRYAVDAANAWQYGGYTVARLGIDHIRTGVDGRRQRYYVAVDNLFDRRYATSAGVTNGAWFYAPGMPRTVVVGAQFDL